MVNRTEKQDKLLNSYTLKVNFDIVKKTIMTKSYNATRPTLVQNVVDNLKEIFQSNYKYYTYKNSYVRFKRMDIVNFVLAIRDVLNIESPIIKELSKYLDSVASISCRLSIPITWALPYSGV